MIRGRTTFRADVLGNLETGGTAAASGSGAAQNRFSHRLRLRRAENLDILRVRRQAAFSRRQYALLVATKIRSILPAAG